MTKKRIILILSFVALLVLALAFSACSKNKDETPTDESKIQAAVNSAQKRIEEYRQNSAALADTVMHFLPDSCVFDESDGLLIYYNGKTYTYNQSLTETSAAHTFYPNLEAATNAENTVGQTVYTLGYYKQFDGGCARYVVDNAAKSDIAVPSGENFLNYASAQNKVNLRQMGWHGDDLWGYEKRFEGFSQINTLVFTKGDYPLLDVVRTNKDNANYFGIEATIYSADNFGGELNKQYPSLWNVRKNWGNVKIVETQLYSGLNFEMRHKTYNTAIEGAKGLAYLLQVSNCRDVKFYNCSFYLAKDLFGGELRKYSSVCMDCFTDWHDITFDSCVFENHTYTNEGGAIAFRDVYNAGCDNLIFTNNRVVSSPRDEGIALFAGWDKRFHLDNPVLGDGYIRNCRLENNEFVALEAAEGLNPRTMFLTVGYQLSPVYNINYINNTFDGYCNSYFLHYCYCYGLNFTGNTVNLRQTGDTSKMSLIYHNDSPDAADIVVEDNTFNLLGENFNLNCVTITSPYSDADELTFRRNIVNLPEGYAEKLIAGNATVKDNTFNLTRAGSIYYRTCGDVSGNTYNIDKLQKYVFEFYNADVKRDLAVKKEKISVNVAMSNLLIFNGTDIKFNGHSLLFEDVQFDIKRVDRQSYHLCWSSDPITDTVVPITFRRCTFGAYEGHLTIGGSKHTLTIE